MSLLRIVLRELVYRRLGFVLGVFGVAVAVGCVLGQFLILGQHDRRTEDILNLHEKEYLKELADLENDIRVYTKNLGFNLVIFPKNVDLAHFSSKGYIDSTMPEEYVDRLSKSPLVSINHLLPVLQRRVFAPEVGLEVMVIGTIGEVAIAKQDKKKPFLEPVQRGKIVLGHELRRRIEQQPVRGTSLIPGSSVSLFGKTFIVQKLQPKQLGPEDTTAWLHLKDAQDLFEQKGRINALYALGCNCSAGRMGVIREEIAAVLPETVVEEYETKATARAESRNRAAQAKKVILEQAALERIELRAQKESFLSVLVPLITLAAIVLLGTLAFLNVRERRGEIGLFRALGWQSTQILGLVLIRSLVVGVLGAVLGLLTALMAGRMLGEGYDWIGTHGVSVAVLLIGAPLASLLAAWLPALLAARQDPAIILQQELT